MSEHSPEPSYTTPHLENNPGLSLDISKILKLSIRTLPYVKPILKELVLLLAVLLPLIVLSIPLGMMTIDLIYNRLLVGEPLTTFEASVLLLEPAQFIDVETLTLQARTMLRSRIFIAVGCVCTLSAPVVLWAIYLILKISQLINQHLRLAIVENVHSQSMRFHSEAKVGDAIYGSYQDSAVITGMMRMLVWPLFPLYRILTMVVAFAFDWRLPFVLLALYVLFYLMAYKMTPALRQGFRHARERNAALMSQIQETLAGIKVIKAYGAETVEQSRFENASKYAFAGAFEGRSRLALLSNVSNVCAALVPVGCMAYFALLAREGHALAGGAALALIGFSLWNLGAYIDLLDRIRSWSGAGHSLLDMWAKAQDMAVGMERAFRHIDQRPEVEEAPQAIELPPFRDAVILRDVQFGYYSDRPVLADINLITPAGTITALVGPTGSGKSTLVSLLLRLYDPDGGQIEIDGHDLRDLKIQSLRANVAIALQENLLFGMSIRDNIRFAVPEASDAAVRTAARVADAEEFILAQAQGYDTPLGERGARLSMGQRQRLSIARAILKDSPILILDEPTAALDAETELRVMDNITAWGKGRAIFLITHRLSTIRRADQIAYLHEGRILEAGSPAALMRKNDGAYRRFVDLESGQTPAYDTGATS